MKRTLRNKTVWAGLWITTLGLLAFSVANHALADDGRAGRPLFGGPSIHLSGGVRTLKSPNVDKYYSAVGGPKISLFSLNLDQSYVSFVGVGMFLQKFGIFAPVFSPVMIFHPVGLGISIDTYFVNTERADRPGGPVGVSLNLDVMRVASFFAK